MRRDTIMPDVGLSLQMWSGGSLEARYRWLNNWEGGQFRLFGLGVVFRRP